MAVTDVKFSNFADGGDLEVADIVVGLRNGVNTRFNFNGSPGLYLPLTGGTMAGAIDMDGNSITGLPSPSFASDAVPKSYVDGLVAGEALTRVNDTNVTLTLGGTPATALLEAVSLTMGWSGQLGLTRGGTNASLTASNGGIVYSTATAMAILAGTATAGQILRSGSSAAPSWSTAAYPDTAGTVGNVLKSDGTNFVSAADTPGALTQNHIYVGDASNVAQDVAMSGDATIVASGALTIANNAVSNAKLAQMATLTIKGNNTGSTANALDLTVDQVNTMFNIVDKVSLGRLTLTSGTPVTTSNVTAATTLYFTPYKGNIIDLYTGSVWQRFTFSEISIAIPATTVTVYDVWVYNNSGTPALELLAWTNVTTRATALTTQNGVYVKSGDPTRRYVGSIYTTGVSGQTEDSDSNRFVWNYYNRVCRPISCSDSTNSWTYSSSTIRQANGSAANQVNYVIGVAEDTLHAFLVVSAQGNSTGTNAIVGIGINSTTVNSAQTTMGAMQVAATGTVAIQASYNGIPSIGANFMTWLESNRTNANTVTWFGDNNDPTVIRSGLSMEMWG